MNLIIFDIDGTLTDTFTLDATHFLESVQETFPITEVNQDWTSYRYSTDSGILSEIVNAHCDRHPTKDELQSVRDKFVARIKNDYVNDASTIQPIAGAVNIFDHIRTLNHWHIAIATGGWSHSALYKLGVANIPHEDVPKAFADDDYEREEIINAAIERSQSYYGVRDYNQVVYIGDGEWDKRAADNLSINFIGIGERVAHHADIFKISDYKNPHTLLEYLMGLHQLSTK